MKKAPLMIGLLLLATSAMAQLSMTVTSSNVTYNVTGDYRLDMSTNLVDWERIDNDASHPLKPNEYVRLMRPDIQYTLISVHMNRVYLAWWDTPYQAEIQRAGTNGVWVTIALEQGSGYEDDWQDIPDPDPCYTYRVRVNDGTNVSRWTDFACICCE